MKFSKLIGLIILLFSTASFAGDRYTQYLLAINKNVVLKENLKSMGYSTPEKAAEAFEKAEDQLAEADIQADWGTLAICGSLGGMMMAFKFERMMCTTLFHAYTVEIEGLGVTLLASMSVNIGGLFFTVSDRNLYRWCYGGGGAAFYYYKGGSIGGGSERKCISTGGGGRGPEYDVGPWIKNGGWVAFIEGGVGAGAEIFMNMMRISRLITY